MHTAAPQKYHYQPISRQLEEPTGSYGSYGLCLLVDEGPTKEIRDISTDPVFVEKLAERFTRFQLSPVHFIEAVEDALVALQ